MNFVDKLLSLFNDKDIKINALALIGPLVVIIGTLLPWLKYVGIDLGDLSSLLGGSSKGSSENMWVASNGALLFYLALEVAVLVLLKMQKAAIIPAAIAAAAFLLSWFTTDTGMTMGIGSKLGFGFYVVLIGVAAMVGVWFIKVEIYLEDLIGKITKK